MVRLTAFFTLLPLLAVAQPKAATLRVANVNFYGMRKTHVDKVRAIVPVKPGDQLPNSKGELEERLEELPGVVVARVGVVCCEGGRFSLFVGIEEKGSAHFDLHSPPAGNAVLPPEMLALNAKLAAAAEAATRAGRDAEDLTAGHSLLADSDARALQLQLAIFAGKNLKLLKDVLRNSALEEHRALSATAIAYAPDKSLVIDDLVYAMQDADETVRANAMRSLTGVAVLAKVNPKLELKIPAIWFIEMLNSVVLSDRTRAVRGLLMLTETAYAPGILLQLRERSLPAILEMARWENLEYALPPFLLAGRMAGLSDDDAQKAWQAGKRETVLDEFTKKRRR